MSQQFINIGAHPSDGSGDPIRVAFDKINQNFLEIYAATILATSQLNSVINGDDWGYLNSDWGLVAIRATEFEDYGSIK